MALFNQKNKQHKTINHAGGEAYAQTPEMQLVSILLTSFVQDQFYRSAKGTLDELSMLSTQVEPEFAAKAAVFARNEYGMRSISHALAAELAVAASGTSWGKAFYNKIVHRPDDMLEIAAAYRSKGGKHLSNAMKKGFAEAFGRFDAYQLAKYRGEGKAFKLIDLVNLVHPVGNDRNAEGLKQLVNDTLRNTKTWEAKLSATGQHATDEDRKAEMKAEAWTELLQNGKLGYLALLRNLRNMAEQAPDSMPLMVKALSNREAIKKSLVMPFQIMIAMDAIQAADLKQTRDIENALSDALEISLENVPRFEGRTLVVLDDSGSMATRANAQAFGSRSCISLGASFAAALFKTNDADLMRFADNASYIKANNRDAMMSIAQTLIDNAKCGGTNFHAIFEKANQAYDRIIILSDMQGWIGHHSANETFNKYCQRYGVKPYLYSFDLAGYGTMQLPDSKVFCLAGFSDKVFDLMQMLETDRHALVNTIKALNWD
jgi:60 kDa SS-A/Ro ribonucleoprotein